MTWTYFCALWLIIGTAASLRDFGETIDSMCASEWRWCLWEGFAPR